MSRALWPIASTTTDAGMKPDDVFTSDTAILSLYTTFQEDAAAGVHITFELRHLGGEIVVPALVDDGSLKASAGCLPAPDLVIEPQSPAMLDLLNGSLDAAGAISSGKVRIEGDPAHLELFTWLFHIPPAPDPAEGLSVR